MDPSPSASGFLPRAEAWLAARRRGVVLLLLSAAVVFRIAYFLEINHGPCSAWQEWNQTDLHFFDQWGRRIAEGDWLSREAGHPFHFWHENTAKAYFESRPAEEEELKRLGKDPLRALWDRWYGGPLFHQEPLYPYLVGITYAVVGPEPQGVYAWQMALGVASILLVWSITRRHFGDLAAAVAGALAVLCGPILFYENVLLRTSPTVFAALGLFAVFESAFEIGGWRRWAGAGAALGGAILLQSTFILFGLGALALLLWRCRRRWKEALPPVGIVAGTAFLCLTPALARNAAVGAPVLGLSSVGPVTFIASNAPGYDPADGFAVDDRQIAGIMSASDGKFGAAVRRTISEHSFGGYVSLLAAKFAALWHDHEKPNNKSFYYYRRHATILASTFVPFLVIAPLAILGMAAAAREGARHALLYLLPFAVGLPMLIFYVLSRFRAPFTLALIPFAAYGLVRLADWTLTRRWKSAALATGALALMAVWMGRPIPDNQLKIRSADYRAAFLTHWHPREQEFARRGDWLGAVGVLDEALAEEPAEVRSLDGSPIPRKRIEMILVTSWFEVLHRYRAGHLQRAGRAAEADADIQRAEVLKKSCR